MERNLRGMACCRALTIIALLFGATLSFAGDYRLVVASDDPAIRNAGSIVVFDGSGKLTKEDRITSITFSALADVKPNALVSLDPSSGKASLGLSPDVQVYKGKVMIAGSKPTRKVIPAHIEIDVPVAGTQNAGKLSSVMQPIIQQVNNLPWVYIGGGIGLFMMFMIFMNRRSQQFTTSMSKEAKSLYLETVGRITERLDTIESGQRNLVKNPPVVRAFRAQIEDFEGRLNRIEKLAKESNENLLKASAELSKGGDRYQNITVKLDESKAETAKVVGTLKQEADALRAELKLILKSQDGTAASMGTSLGKLEAIEAAAARISEQSRQLEEKLADQGQQILTAQAGSTEQMKSLMAEHSEALVRAQATADERFQTLNNELQILRSNQESLLAMPQQLELVSASMATQFDSVRSSMPRMDGWQDRFDGISIQLNDAHSKLDTLPEIKNTVEALPQYHEDFARIHDSLLQQIESLGGKVESGEANLAELINAHSFSAPTVVDEVEIQVDEIQVVEEPEAVAEETLVLEDAPVEDVFVAEVEAFEECEQNFQSEFVETEVEAVAEETAVIEEVEVVAEVEEEVLEPVSEIVAEAEIAAEVEDENFVSTVEEQTFEEVVDVVEAVQEDEVAFELTSFDEEPEMLVDESVAEVEASEEVQVESLFDALQTEEATMVCPIYPDLPAETEVEAVIAEVVEHQEPAFQVTELAYRYADDSPVVPEFHFNQAIEQILKEEHPVEEAVTAPTSFKLEPLPERLETFEDSGEDAILSTFQAPIEELANSEEETEAVESLLEALERNKPEAELDAFDADPEPEEVSDASTGAWNGLGGSSARTWSSEVSRPLEVVRFEGELKPMTPIGTAPIGDEIGAMAYGFGKVVYTCGKNVHGFWPGRDDRVASMDNQIGTEEWRVAVRGQNLFVAEENKVRVFSLQGWFSLEQFSGKYQDQLLTDSRWIGLKDNEGQATLDFRDFRGGMSSGGVRLDIAFDQVQLCSTGSRVFAGSRQEIKEVSEFGTELLGSGPDGGELLHLTATDSGPVAVYRVGEHLECWQFGEQTRWTSLEMSEYAAHPVLMGGKLFLVNLANAELVSVNLKKMNVHKTRAFEGVTSLRRLVGLQHRSTLSIAAVTSDEGKKSGRLVLVDAKNGNETTFGSVGQSNVNLIVADHHLILSTSSAYQNVIRVLEPFGMRVAA